MKDTVNRALQEVIAVDGRRWFLDRIVRSDRLDLDDTEVMDDAWL